MRGKPTVSRSEFDPLFSIFGNLPLSCSRYFSFFFFLLESLLSRSLLRTFEYCWSRSKLSSSEHGHGLRCKY